MFVIFYSFSLFFLLGLFICLVNTKYTIISLKLGDNHNMVTETYEIKTFGM